MKSLYLIVNIDFKQIDMEDQENPLQDAKKLFHYEGGSNRNIIQTAEIELGPNEFSDSNNTYRFGPFG